VGYAAHHKEKYPTMLTDIEVKAAQGSTKPQKLFDSNGLYLLVTVGTDGLTRKKWRFRFKFHKKEKLLALGVYPAVTLAEARRRRDKARTLLAEGIDPTAERRSSKRESSLRLANTFVGLANDWFETKQAGWSPRYAADTRKFLDRELVSEFGAVPVSDIAPRDLLTVIRKIEGRDAPAVAEKVLNIGGQIFRHGVRTGLMSSDPSRDLRGALKSRQVRHHARLTEAELPEFLKRLDGFSGSPVTKMAMQLLLLTAVRTQELRFAEWSEIDFDARIWRIPAHRMKSRKEHLVPLSSQAVSALKSLQSISGRRRYIFPNEHHPGSKAMSENTVLFALYRLGYRSRLTGHGFRSMFSTILHESGQFESRAIELQLAHSDKDKIRSIYNGALYMAERTKIMAWWADFLDSCRQLKGPDESAVREYRLTYWQPSPVFSTVSPPPTMP
jgi:integrase